MLILETIKRYLNSKGVQPYQKFKVHFKDDVYICEVTETAFWEYKDSGTKVTNEDLAYLILNNNVYIEKV
jgi:hypothetical protein